MLSIAVSVLFKKKDLPEKGAAQKTYQLMNICVTKYIVNHIQLSMYVLCVHKYIQT